MSRRDARKSKISDNLMAPKIQVHPAINPQVIAVIRTNRVKTRLQHRKKKSK